jgi:hypothetical protein
MQNTERKVNAATGASRRNNPATPSKWKKDDPEWFQPEQREIS